MADQGGEEACELATTEVLDTIMAVITAVATLLIALVAQIFSWRNQEAQEIEELKKDFQDMCNGIKVAEVTKLLVNQRIYHDNAERYLSGTDWNKIWTDMDYADPQQLTARIVFTNYIDALRACSVVFDKIQHHKNKSEIFLGQFDYKAKNLRFTAKAFRRWYLLSFDGVMEDRQSYAQREVGSKKDWNKIIKLLGLFDPELDPTKMQWMDPKKDE